MHCNIALPCISASQISLLNCSHNNGTTNRTLRYSGSDLGIIGTVFLVRDSPVIHGDRNCASICNTQSITILTSGGSRFFFSRGTGSGNACSGSTGGCTTGLSDPTRCIVGGDTRSFLCFNVSPTAADRRHITRAICRRSCNKGAKDHRVFISGRARVTN